MSKLFAKVSSQSINGVRKELARAHLIITLLAISAIMLLVLGVAEKAPLDPTLAGICGGLLIIVVIISINVSLSLYNLKK